MNAPVPFNGTDEERRVNRDSHSFSYTGGPEDADVRCMFCDSRPSHTAADYPCGADVPRYETTQEDGEAIFAEWVARYRAEADIFMS